MSNNVPTVNVKVIGVGELKERIPTSGTGTDKQLERACTIASLALETLCEPTKFVQRVFTEDYAAGANGRLGGVKRLYLHALPIVSVTSITDDDANTVASTEYTIIADEGILEHDTYWPAPVGRWTIVYTAGHWEDTDDVDYDVKEAAMAIVLRNRNFKGDNVQSTSLSGRAGSRSVTRGAAGAAARGEIENMVIAKYRRRGV